jgi:hypothetical protein
VIGAQLQVAIAIDAESAHTKRTIHFRHWFGAGAAPVQSIGRERFIRKTLIAAKRRKKHKKERRTQPQICADGRENRNSRVNLRSSAVRVVFRSPEGAAG